MRSLVAAASVFVVLGGIAGAVFSCGSDGSSDSTTTVKGETEAESPENVVQAFSLEINAAAVAVPAGALEAGSKLLLKTVDVPDTFANASADVSPGSVAVEMSGTGPDGQPLLQAKAPIGVAINVDGSAALAGVEKTEANLCAFGLGKDGVFRIWRNGVLKIKDGKVAFPSIWMAVFRLYYCGATPIANSFDVNDAGTDVAGASPISTSTNTSTTAGSLLASCDVTEMHQCQRYAGRIYDDEKQRAALKASCEELKGKFGTGDVCPAGSILYTCAYHYGTVFEFGMTIYTSAGTEGLPQLKAACENTPGAKYFEGVGYSPTPGAQQTTPQTSTSTSTATGPSGTDTSTASDLCTGPRSCYMAGEAICETYVGSSYAGQDSSLMASCSSNGGTWIPTAGCSTSSMATVLGCCARYGGTSGNTQINALWFAEEGFDVNLAAAACTAGQGIWTPAAVTTN